MSTRASVTVLALIAPLALLACSADRTTSAEPVTARADADTQGALLASIRAATAKYHRVEEAIADGYAPRTACVAGEGIHYAKPSLVDAVLDPTQPEQLLYDVLPDGNLRLVGVLFLIPTAAWDATQTSSPMLGDQPFMDRHLPPLGAPFPNYALYVWVWLHNPDGTYTLKNPQVTC